MNIKKLEDQYFIFSNTLENPNKFFQGYCFVGADYIFGDEGRQKYFDERGIKINGGEDGCYVSVEKVGNDFLFFSDFYGYKKIFYYWTTELWIVSNSIELIVQHLKDSKVKLTTNYSQLSTIGIPKLSFYNQLYSVNTFVNGVKLLPTESFLVISESGYSIKEVEKKIDFHTYEQGIANFIGVWVARLAGLLNNGIEIQSDLTGGADSRTVFTILKKATEISINTNTPLLRSKSTPNNTVDLEIAEKISKFYNFSINAPSRFIRNKLSGEESYLSWKILCLGIYHPIYFPNAIPQPNIVTLGGGGAENHRHFYKYNNIKSFINSTVANISPSWLSYNISAEIMSELDRMIHKSTVIDPMILHYRSYRNRMHAGRTPQYITSFNPLGSKILEFVSEIAGNERVKNGQINYDIMATLLPSILNIPFDNETKAFNEVRKNNLTILKEWKNFKPGNVYIDDNPKLYNKAKTMTAFELLNADFQTAKNNKFVKDFFGAEFINEAESSMANAVENKRFPHAIDGQGVAAIIAASLFE